MPWRLQSISATATAWTILRKPAGTCGRFTHTQWRPSMNLSFTAPGGIVAAASAAIFVSGCGGHDHDHHENHQSASLEILSSRAEYVSGGSALVKARLPHGVASQGFTVMAGKTDVTSAFVSVADGE